MYWQKVKRSDPRAVALADRHYTRQSIGYPDMMPPGRCLVLITPDGNAVWGTAWPYAQYVKHAWGGAWICSIFRNESEILSSDLITQAVAATRYQWPEVPALGMVTMVNRDKIRPKRDPGRCFRRAGFTVAGMTKSGLVVLQLLPHDMPAPDPAAGAVQEEQCELFSSGSWSLSSS